MDKKKETNKKNNSQDKEKQMQDVELNENNETKEKELDQDNEINNLKEKLNDLDDKYKRSLAEFENYKKRTEKERIRTYERAKIDLVQKLLPVIDSLESAKEISEDKEYIEGLNQVYKQISEFLTKNNIEEIKTIGEIFDPELHEAISVVDSDEDEGTIIEEFRKGYKIGNDIIRHSMVIVSK